MDSLNFVKKNNNFNQSPTVLVNNMEKVTIKSQLGYGRRNFEIYAHSWLRAVLSFPIYSEDIWDIDQQDQA